jgi:release factor glutamine methyltransferase
VTAGDALRAAEAELAGAGIETPRVDAELLLAHVLGTGRTRLYAERARELSREEQARIDELVARRARREPLAYVLGEWGFRRLTLKIDRRALVPRPETEVVVERCLELLRGRAEPDVLDVGVGSGAIALALADEHPGARVTGVDASPGALALARENAEATGLADRVRLAEHDLRSGFGDRRFDLVVSNPPYIQERELSALQPELRWEPREALVGNGHTDAVAAAAVRALRPGGQLVLEVADGAAGTVAARLGNLGFTAIRITRDLTGTERVVEGRRL